MARVNHKEIKKLISQKVKTVTDRQLFTSPAMSAHFADMVAAQTRRYNFKRRVKLNIIWKPKMVEHIANTNNDVININAGHPLVTKRKGRTDRYMMVCGMNTHELGHILFTDFLMLQTYNNRMVLGNWFPEKPTLRNADERRSESEIRDYINQSPKHMEAFIQMAHHIINVLEDGYIESKMLDRYPGKLGISLKYFREQRFADMPTLTEIIELEEEPGGHIWMTILQLMLSYVIWGEIKYGEESLSDIRVQSVFSLLSVLDKALVEQDPKERFRSLNTILIQCWGFIKEYLDMCIEMADEATASGASTTATVIISAAISGLSGTSEQGEGSSTPVAEIPGSANTPSSADKRAETARQAAAAGQESETDDDSDESGIAQPEEPAADEGDTATSGDSPEEGEQPINQTGFQNSDEVQDVRSQEGGRFEYQKTSEVSIPVGGGTEWDDAYEGAGYGNAAADIERLVEQMVEKEVHRDAEQQRITELNSLANEVAYGNIHEGVDKKIRRIAEVSQDLKDQYMSAAPHLLKISQRLQKSIIQQLKEKRRGGKNTNLYSGRKLYVHALPRNDGRVFYNKKLPNDTSELAIGLLLDESGSMSWSNRATYARSTAIILYDFCQSLGIPIMVYGHSTGSGVDLYSYAEFDCIDRDDKYRMMDISSRGSNRDGAALRYVMAPLSKRPEDVKLLVLVSDGQPADSGYGGSAAEADLRGIKKDCERQGITLVAAAIGDDKECIERIYGDSFMDITDLEKMPQKLAHVVKRHIRV